MALAGVQLDPDSLSCSVCLEVLKDPATVPCGHSYCMTCIQAFWLRDGGAQACSCPQCRQTFTPRPVLVRNTMLAALADQLKKAGLQDDPADRCLAADDDVACDFCPGRKLKAVKSCLSCLASFCQKHLQPHHQVAPLKKHQLVDPSGTLQDAVCPRHNEAIKMFCRTDRQCVCYRCFLDEHQGHHAVSAEAERAERQAELQGSRRTIQKTLQDREKVMDVLQRESDAVDSSADEVVRSSAETFQRLIRILQGKSSELQRLLRSRQEAEARRVHELQETLRREIAELRRKDAELERLSHTQDHILFLQKYPSLSKPGESTFCTDLRPRPLRYFGDAAAAVTEVAEKLLEALGEDWTRILATVAAVDVLLPHPEPRTREDFFKYWYETSLDVNTAHKRLELAKENRGVEENRNINDYPSHPQRFTDCVQVLSRQSFSGRCYWELAWMGESVHIALSYKNISRAGTSAACRFGSNDRSWALNCFLGGFDFWHNNIRTKVSSSTDFRIGVYLDHGAGTLSFFSLSDGMTLLHKVQATFRQPLLVGFNIDPSPFGPSSVQILPLE